MGWKRNQDINILGGDQDSSAVTLTSGEGRDEPFKVSGNFSGKVFISSLYLLWKTKVCKHVEWHHTGCGVCSEDGVAPATQYGPPAPYAGC